MKQEEFNSYININKFIKVVLKYFLAFLLILLVMVLFTSWTPTVSGTGQVIAFNPDQRVQLIQSPIKGRIEKWHVIEGTQVKKGDLIAKVVDIDPERLNRLNKKLLAQKENLKALEKQKYRSKLHVTRMEKLFKKGIESKRNFEIAEIEYFKVISEINKVKVEIQDIESTVSRQSSQDIISPSDGRIVNIFVPAQSGVIKIGETIAKIAPTDVKLASELIISGKNLPLLRDNQKVRLIFEGWPAVQIIGWPSIAVGTFGGKIQVIDLSGDTKGNFRIIVTPTEPWPEQAVRMGLKVKGWIQLKTVPLWWELWRRFSGVPPSV